VALACCVGNIRQSATSAGAKEKQIFVEGVKTMKGRRGRGQYIETRLSVDRGGDWRSFTDTLPKDCAVIGTVTEGANDTGALVQMLDTRNYLKVKAGKITMLNQKRTIAALTAADSDHPEPEMISVEEWEKTKPPQIEDGQRQTGKGESVIGQGGTPPSPELAPRKF
jgi:hypothetical protein